MVTTDADQYLAVEVNSPKNAAVIRERIFTKVCYFPSFAYEMLTC